VNATKAYTGHTLAAAGLVELVATCLQLRGGYLHRHVGAPDPALGPLRFVSEFAEGSRPPDIAISNSFGFGGFNSSLVVAR
jgi:malonyl-ACP decarboxylase